MQCQFVLLNNDSDRFCRRCRCSWLVLAGNNNSPSIVSWQELIWRDEANTLKFEHWVSMSNEIQWNLMFKTFWTDATGTFTQRISATSMVWRRAFQIWRIYALSASMLEERKNYQTSLCIESTLPLCNRSQHQSESLSSSQLLLSHQRQRPLSSGVKIERRFQLGRVRVNPKTAKTARHREYGSQASGHACRELSAALDESTSWTEAALAHPRTS